MNDLLIHIDKKRLVLHTFFWMSWIFGFTFIQSFGFGINFFKAWLFYSLIILPIFMTHTYLIAYWLVPNYFFKHRYWLFFGWIITILIIASVFELVISNELVWKLVKPENRQSGNYLGWQNILVNGFKNEYIIIVFFAIKVISLWNSKMGENADLFNQQLSVETELYKNQLYSRLILNVVDKLEALAQKKSPQTSGMIMHLSNLLNYIVQDEIDKKILLLNEVEIIRNYIDIQKMSFPAGFDVNFSVSGALNGVRIPPFLFFHLVEEGFILLDDFTKDLDFTIRIKSDPDSLLFSMYLLNNQGLNKKFRSEVLENCRKSLQYFYPHNYKMISNFKFNFIELAIEIYF